MSESETSGTSQEQPQQQTSSLPNTITDVSPEQWQAFVGALSEQNNALQQQVAQASGRLNEITAKQRREQIEGMPDKERADALQAQLDAIAQAGQQVQAQEVSNTVWQRRDADAAARILQSHGLTGQEPELYRAAWDVNWMPRFAASVDVAVKAKQTAQKQNAGAANNPANRASVGNGTGSAIPEIPENANGYDTIRFALSRIKQ